MIDVKLKAIQSVKVFELGTTGGCVSPRSVNCAFFNGMVLQQLVPLKST